MNVTAAVVCYNTPDLVYNAVTSFRRFHPKIPVVIIEGSDYGSECFFKTAKMAREDSMVKVIQVGYNIGHGKGLDLAVKQCTTDYVAFVDSDTVTRAPVIQKMLSQMQRSTYGVGKIVRVDNSGKNVASGGFNYLHPYFCLIQKRVYQMFAPATNHGAPLIKAMQGLRRTASYGLKRFPLEGAVVHLERGTRKLMGTAKYWEERR